MNEPIAKRKRPIGVWIISIFYFIYTIWSLFSFKLTDSSVIQTPSGQPDIVIELTALDHFLAIISIGIALAAAIALFLLKKAAVYLYAVNLGLSIAVSVRTLTADWNIDFGANFNFGVFLIFTLVFVLLIQLIFFRYIWSLKQKGVLT